MDRTRLLHSLRAARNAHQHRIGHALAVLEGMVWLKEMPLVDARGCPFVLWYQGEGRQLSGLSEFAAIAPLHNRLHRLFHEIAALHYGRSESSPLSHLLGFQPAIRTDRTRRLTDEIAQLSRQILALLKRKEQALEELPDGELRGRLAVVNGLEGQSPT